MDPHITSAVISIAISVAGLAFAGMLAKFVVSSESGDKLMNSIASAIQVGARAFLKQEMRTVGYFVAGGIILIGIVTLQWQTVICFIVGAVLSSLSGYIGMSISVLANVRTAAAARTGLNKALRVAFNSGTVMAFCVVGSGLLGLAVLYLAFGANPHYLAGFGMGASSIALFARVGGGIYTKGADVGADLVGKVESDLPEDDPRNPGVVADLVGDNVGDVAGMGADLFESYVGSIIAAVTLAVYTEGSADEIAKYAAVPFWVASCGILSSMIGSFAVRTKENATQNSLLFAMRMGVFVSFIFIVGGSALIIYLLEVSFNIFGCIVIGLVCGVLIGLSTEYATSFAFKPTISIAEQGVTGAATVIIQGLGVGMLSTVPPVIFVCASILGCVSLAGVYGVSVSAVGMLSTLGVTLATDAYGPVADNAGGIAEMSELPPEVRDRTDQLDSLGNTTAATGKGFAIGSAVLTAFGLMTAYTRAVNVSSLDLIGDPMVIPGILFGCMLPFIFAALTMLAVGNCAKSVIEEVRRQFREIPGLKAGDEGVVADYQQCVEITTAAALQEMVVPGALAIVFPIIIGLSLGASALAGVLIGSITTGFLLAVTMANAGGAWDNAKKYVEAGAFGGKNTETHKACVVGDTVGDPFKDTSGPSLNILLKLMSIVSLVLAPMFKPEVQEGIWYIGIIVLLIAIMFLILWRKYLGAVHDKQVALRAQTAELKEVVPTSDAPKSETKDEPLVDQVEEEKPKVDDEIEI